MALGGLSGSAADGAAFGRAVPHPASPAADAAHARMPERPVGRFAPSPSGRMHLGNVYASLLAWLSVRSRGGRMVLRIEDLDERTKSGLWTSLVMEDLRWLGLDWDEGPYYQRERIELYREAMERLDAHGLMYPCFCTRAELHAASAPHASDGTPVYAGTCRGLSGEEVARRREQRPPAWRLRVPAVDDPAGAVTFTDRVFGPQREVLARDCGDFLVRRSDGVFAYQLAVVVDDAAMGVTEVVRGCDLLGSVARQIYLQRLLGYATPAYAHVPLMVAADGRRLSKRDRDCDMGELRKVFGTSWRLLGAVAHAAGLVPDACPRTADELVDAFSWDAVPPCRAVDASAVMASSG